MSLQRGEVLGYDFNRMVVDFTMSNQGKIIHCAITTAAMGDLEEKRDLKADQRIDQFLRLRDAIEERASRKYAEGPVESQGQVVTIKRFLQEIASRGPAGMSGPGQHWPHFW